MLRGEIIHDGWRNEAVREALDLCLACKGCKSDCPTHTDMASYKAEFLHHHYLAACARCRHTPWASINRWSKLAALAPRLINLLAATPGLAALLKFGGGVAQQREIPKFARRTFRKWFARRRAPATGAGRRGRVILWADTFNNHFQPGSAAAAVEVLEALGYTVTVPRQQLAAAEGRSTISACSTPRACLPARDPRCARRRNPGRRTGDRPGTGMPVGVPRRTAQPVSGRCAGRETGRTMPFCSAIS